MSVVGQNRGVNSAPPALLAAAVQRREPRLLALSHAIHAEPELAFAEHRSAARVADLVESEEPYQPLRTDPSIEDSARERLAALRSSRSSSDVTAALDEMRRAAEGTDNVLYPMKRALAASATLGEVCHALRDVWGSYVPSETF